MEGRGKSVHWLKHYCLLTYFVYIIAWKEKTANNVFTPVRLSDSAKNTSVKQDLIKPKNVCLISDDVYNVLPHGLVLLSG